MNNETAELFPARASDRGPLFGVVPGDVWELGPHRLYCGDSTHLDAVLAFMLDDRADVIFTDPPYGVQYQGDGGDSIAGDVTYTAIPLMFSILPEVLKPGAWLYICGGSTNMSLYSRLFERYFRMTPRLIVWDKGRMVMRRNGYHSCCELIYVGYVKGGGATWHGSRAGEGATDVWRVDSPGEEREHLTEKPVELPRRAIMNSTPAGGIVFDPFAGSGSTLLAAQILGRRCYAIEIEPTNCEIILRRYRDLTRETPVRERSIAPAAFATGEEED